jgi:hypothetical protein
MFGARGKLYYLECAQYLKSMLVSHFVVHNSQRENIISIAEFANIVSILFFSPMQL